MGRIKCGGAASQSSSFREGSVTMETNGNRIGNCVVLVREWKIAELLRCRGHGEVIVGIHEYMHDTR